MRKLSFIIIIFAMLIVVACGHDDSNTTVESSLSANFTPIASKPASGTVALQENSINDNIVYIDVKITDLNSVFGASIKLSYDPNIVRWGGSYQPGNFLESSAPPNYAVALDSNSDGCLVIGISLAAPAAPVNGSGVLVTIPFQVITIGNSPLTFTGSFNLYDDKAPAPTALMVNSWDGGIISGN